MQRFFEKGAPRRPFSFLPLLLALATPPPAEAADECRPPEPAREVSVRHVIDGDTVILSDGEHARLIGINTPEIVRDGPDEPLARQARQAAAAFVDRASDRLVALTSDERRDRHGRRLIHLMDTRGQNLQAILLERGLAVAIYVAPNVKLAECYRRAERTARKNGRGLWDRPDTVTAADRITPDTRGFRVVTGRIRSSRRFDNGLRLRFHDGFHLWLPDAALARFSRSPARLVDRRVLVRGWLYDFRGEAALRVDHPFALIDCNNDSVSCPRSGSRERAYRFSRSVRARFNTAL